CDRPAARGAIHPSRYDTPVPGEHMIEFETTIQAKSAPNGAQILAWKTTPESALCCHPEYDCGKESIAPTAWTITHIETGLSVNPSRVPDKHAAMLLLAEYEQLPGWD